MIHVLQSSASQEVLFHSEGNQPEGRAALQWIWHSIHTAFSKPSEKKRSCGILWVRNDCWIDFKHNYCLDSESFFQEPLLLYSIATARPLVWLTYCESEKTWFYLCMKNILKVLELYVFVFVFCFYLGERSTLPLLAQLWNLVVVIIVLFLVVLNVCHGIDRHYTLPCLCRCRGKSGGHPGQQDVHLPPLLECSWSASI